MPRHDPRIRIHHMLDHAQEALEMAHGRSRSDLDSDRMLNLALMRLMEVIGEAAARVPEEFRSQHPHVPWRNIADLRNRLIHGYDSIDFDILWVILQSDLPPLIEQLRDILTAEENVKH